MHLTTVHTREDITRAHARAATRTRYIRARRPPRLLFSITIGYQACRGYVAAASMTSAFARNRRGLLPLSISQLVNATRRYSRIGVIA